MKKGKLTLLGTLLLLGVLPLVLTAIILTAFSVQKINSVAEEDIYEKLHSAAKGLAMYYEWDIVNTGEAVYEHDYVDCQLSEGIELTLFLEDVRYITSVKNENGQRNEGTKASADVWAKVKAGNVYYGNKVPIGGQNYYVCYLPLKGSDGTVLGMAFAGESDADVQAALTSASTSSLLLSVVLALIFTGIVIYVALIIRKRLTAVIDATDELAKGNLHVDLNLKSSIIEIDNLIASATKLRDNTTEVIGAVIEQTGNLDSNMNQIAESVKTSNSAAEGITNAVEELAKGSMDMAESVENCVNSTSEIGDGIGLIRDLANRTVEIASNVKAESNNAKANLNELLHANAQTVEISNEVTDGISASAKAVSNIKNAAEVIASIASQTSLLALNASIEAARAGEAGRGFAVVATEISNLANQSNNSTQEIQKIVEEIMQKSENNVLLANRIKQAVDNEGSVLTQVSGSFDVVNQNIEECASAVAEITESSSILDQAKDKVLDEISNLSAISEENAANCQQTNASMEELAANITTIHGQSEDTLDISKKLNEAVAYFKL